MVQLLGNFLAVLPEAALLWIALGAINVVMSTFGEDFHKAFLRYTFPVMAAVAVVVHIFVADAIMHYYSFTYNDAERVVGGVCRLLANGIFIGLVIVMVREAKRARIKEKLEKENPDAKEMDYSHIL